MFSIWTASDFIHQGSSRFRKQTWCCKAIISENITCTDVESRCRLFQVVLPPGASGEIREVFQGILSFDLGKTPRTPCVWMTQAIHALHIIYKYARQTQISEKTKHHPVFDSQTKYIYIYINIEIQISIYENRYIFIQLLSPWHLQFAQARVPNPPEMIGKTCSEALAAQPMGPSQVGPPNEWCGETPKASNAVQLGAGFVTLPPFLPWVFCCGFMMDKIRMDTLDWNFCSIVFDVQHWVNGGSMSNFRWTF